MIPVTKKAKWALGICLALLIVGTVGFVAIRNHLDNQVVFSADGAVVIRWQQLGTPSNSLTQALSEEDANKVKDILSRCHYDGAAVYGCYFDENCSIAIGNTVFQLSQDGCPNVRNPQAGRCFQLNVADWRVIAQIFGKYGGKI